MGDTLTLEQFRQSKESGVDLHAEQQQSQEDAAPELEEQEVHEEQEEIATQPEQEDEIPQEHQSAWQKRAERERKKGAEEAEAKLKEEYESQLNPYKAFFDQLGMKPEDAMKAIEQNRIKQEADNLAYQNGWTDEQAQYYIEQQRMKSEQTEMKVSLKVYELSESSDYPGIKQMKGPITEFIRNNPNVAVEQAYWAVGGSSLAQQLKRETEQREIAKRSQTTRKVVTDQSAPMDNKSALPPEAVAFMKREGMTESQVRALLSDAPKNLDEYRKMNRRK